MDPTKTNQSSNSNIRGFSVLDDFQRMYANQGKFKNQLDEIATAMQKGGGGVEREPVVAAAEKSPDVISEIPVNPEIEKKPELSGYMENVEKAAESLVPVIDDYTNQVLLGSANPSNVKVKLPLADDKIEEGLHHKAWEAIRWLAEWCLRQIKIVKSKQAAEMAEL